MFTLIRRNLRQRPLRYILTTLAITFGVAAVTAVFVFTDGLRDTFDELSANIQSGFDIAVRNELAFGDGSQIPLVPINVADEIAAVDGVNSVQPRVIDFSIVAIDDDDEPAIGTGPNIGLNWEYETPNPRLFVQEGVSPTGPGEFVIDVDGYEGGNFTVGQQYQVITPDGSDRFTLVGTFNYADEEENASVGAVLIAFAPEVALDLINDGKGYNDITITADDPDAVAERLQPVLAANGDTLVAQTQQDLIDEQQGAFGQILNIFRTVLLVFAFIILLVSAFLIFNVFNITLGQRIKELGLLRSIGAFGSQITSMMLGEALLLGAIATIVGLPFGWVLARVLRFGLSQAGFPGDTGLPIRPTTILYALLVGVVVTVLAALVPSIRARQVSPLSALRDDVSKVNLNFRARPPGAIVLIVTGAFIMFLAFSFDGWLSHLFLPLIAGILFFIGVRFFNDPIRDFAPFVLLAVGLVLLTVVRFADLSLGETFGLLGGGAALTIVGFAQVSPIFGGPVSRLLGSKVAAGILLFLGAILALSALGMVGFAIFQLTSEPAFVLLVIPAILVGLLAYGLIRTAWSAFGLTGRLGRENAARNPHRTATTATALMIGLALVTAVTVIGDSIKTSVASALGSSITSDWLIQGPQNGPQGIPFSKDVAERVEALPEIDSVLSYQFSFAGYAAIEGEGITVEEVEAAVPQLFGALSADDSTAIDAVIDGLGADNVSIDTLLATEFATLDIHIDPEWIEQDPSLLGDGTGIYMEDGTAADRGLALGDTFIAVFLDGQVEELTVAGIYGNGFVLGDRAIDLELWNRHQDVETDQFISATTADGVEHEDARAAIENELEVDYPLLTTQDREEFAAQQEGQIDQTLAVINVLLAFSAGIAILGITIALSLAVFERTREIGLLRAVGLTKQQTRWMIRWEGVIVAAFGGILGVIPGVGLGILATQKMPEFLVNKTTIPVGQLITYVIVAAVTGLLAGVFPAWIAGRMNILDSISAE